MQAIVYLSVVDVRNTICKYKRRFGALTTRVKQHPPTRSEVAGFAINKIKMGLVVQRHAPPSSNSIIDFSVRVIRVGVGTGRLCELATRNWEPVSTNFRRFVGLPGPMAVAIALAKQCSPRRPPLSIPNNCQAPPRLHIEVKPRPLAASPVPASAPRSLTCLAAWYRSCTQPFRSSSLVELPTRSYRTARRSSPPP